MQRLSILTAQAVQAFTQSSIQEINDMPMKKVILFMSAIMLFLTVEGQALENKILEVSGYSADSSIRTSVATLTRISFPNIIPWKIL